MMKHSTDRLFGISLSTGYGGLDKALTNVFPTLEFSAVCDIEAFPIANLVSKMEKGIIPPAPIWTDLTTFPYKDFRDCIDILCAGFPCQPFSGAVRGESKSTDSVKYLWEHISRGIEELNRPSILFFENVKGMLETKLKSDMGRSKKGDWVLKHICSAMQELGYEVQVGVFHALEVGCAHPRPRVFILGVQPKVPQRVANALANTACFTMEFFEDFLQNFENSAQDMNMQILSSVERDNLEIQNLLTEAVFDYALSSSSSPVRLAAPAWRNETQYTWEPPRALRKDSAVFPWTSLFDELKMIGNGVVPEQAQYAFCELLAAIFKQNRRVL